MITLDHTDLSKWKLKTVGQTVNPATPDIRTKTMDIPGMPGSWDYGSDWGPRTFTIPLYIQESDMYERQRLMREFVAFLLDSYGRPRPIKLTFDYDPDKYYEVKLNSRIDPERLFRLNKFELSLIAHDPIAKFIVPSNQISWDSDVPIMSDVLWGMGETEFNITRAQVIEIVNSGNVATRLGVEITGSGTNVKLSANGTTMALGSFRNQKFEIDGRNYTIFRDGVEDLITTEFIDLLPGVNRINITGSNLSLVLREKYSYQYI